MSPARSGPSVLPVTRHAVARVMRAAIAALLGSIVAACVPKSSRYARRHCPRRVPLGPLRVPCSPARKRPPCYSVAAATPLPRPPLGSRCPCASRSAGPASAFRVRPRIPAAYRLLACWLASSHGHTFTRHQRGGHTAASARVKYTRIRAPPPWAGDARRVPDQTHYLLRSASICTTIPSVLPTRRTHPARHTTPQRPARITPKKGVPPADKSPETPRRTTTHMAPVHHRRG